MGKQMIKRILKAVLYVFIIVTLVFLLMRQLPIETYCVGMKPVIYLYPETETRVTVKLDLPGELTCAYPAYDGGWDNQHKIRGGSFMEMFCLDFNQPLRVVAQCSDEELEALCNDARKFLVR